MESFVQVDSLAAAQKEAKILRDEHKCNMPLYLKRPDNWNQTAGHLQGKVVLALTHQFASEDCKLSKAARPNFGCREARVTSRFTFCSQCPVP